MRFIMWGVVCCFMVVLCGCSTAVSGVPSDATVLIDPGHGGPDGGAVAEDGTLEKDLNLSVSLRLRDMLAVCGVRITMTRTTDVSIHGAEATSIRDKKVSDLRNRLMLYQQSALVISIHQNRFQQPQYAGTQVFYAAANPESMSVAQAVQQAVVTYLQPHNKRPIKAATDGVYLMYHTTVPAVLIECGFMSNPQELLNLKDEHYRQKMAFAITAGYWNYRTER